MRRFVEASLGDWQGDPSPVVLAASELATNAVLHARTRYTVRIGVGEGGTVRLEVRDGERSERLPQESGDEDRDGGWGLRLVARIASSWGIDPHPDGKTVWAEIPPDSQGR